MTEAPLPAENDVMLVAIGRRPYIKGLYLENIDVEIELRRRIVINDQFNTSVSDVKYIGDVTFGLTLATRRKRKASRRRNICARDTAT